MSPPRCERVHLTQTGWAQDLEADFTPQETPTPRPDQVLVRVHACGVCYRDLIDREGRFPFLQLPRVPGHEAAGEVVAVGGKVTDFAVGDHVGTMHRDACGGCEACVAGEPSLCAGAAWVLGLLADGGYARHLLVPASALFPVPRDLPWAHAAVLHCTYGTAWRALVTVAGVQAGQRVLVTGANGGVGGAAIQIAARLGAEVVAVVRDPARVEYVRGLGAHQVEVDDSGRFHKRVGGIHVAVDCVGAPTVNASLRSLAVGGQVVLVGNVTDARVELNVGRLIVFGVRLAGVGGANRADMRALLASGPFEVPIAATLPLERADEAQRRLRAGGVEGRLVLEIPAEHET